MAEDSSGVPPDNRPQGGCGAVHAFADDRLARRPRTLVRQLGNYRGSCIDGVLADPDAEPARGGEFGHQRWKLCSGSPLLRATDEGRT